MVGISEFCVRNLHQDLAKHSDQLKAIADTLKPEKEHYKNDEEFMAAITQWSRLNFIAGHLEGSSNGLALYLSKNGSDSA